MADGRGKSRKSKEAPVIAVAVKKPARTGVLGKAPMGGVAPAVKSTRTRFPRTVKDQQVGPTTHILGKAPLSVATPAEKPVVRVVEGKPDSILGSVTVVAPLVAPKKVIPLKLRSPIVKITKPVVEPAVLVNTVEDVVAPDSSLPPTKWLEWKVLNFMGSSAALPEYDGLGLCPPDDLMGMEVPGGCLIRQGGMAFVPYVKIVDGELVAYTGRELRAAQQGR